MILSIESSCDDSSISITHIETKKIVFYKKISQESEHSEFGGVVPELASRLHAVALPQILEETKNFFPQLKAVAVTNGPGLSVTLMEGVEMAKTISAVLNIPIIAVNHLKAHIYSLFIEKETIFPILVLLISGGHTMIVKVESLNSMQIIASTMDDSIGESFDKCAKMMNLGYPGGPEIEKLANLGDGNRFNFPVPLSNSPLLAFSLSGLKNAVRVQIEQLGGAKNLSEQDKRDISASFQKAITTHLLQKSKKILTNQNIKDFAIVGGAAANESIRDAFASLCGKLNIMQHFVELRYCSDNAAMVGRIAIDYYLNNQFTDYKNISTLVSRKREVGEL
ncbi:MAG: tRNA (adenosine(37)-N6)-threonylcarbamoyltransferase complex transferase subunit TsaD [Epsilonproteobacteria bacterium]|nr:tRNA (adenosine(37)-N6)-threonylcarbamoyltransferase complex transferase subunit TsaD [Campylobacterota bacterium]